MGLLQELTHSERDLCAIRTGRQVQHLPRAHFAPQRRRPLQQGPARLLLRAKLAYKRLLKDQQQGFTQGINSRSSVSLPQAAEGTPLKCGCAMEASCSYLAGGASA